MSTADIDRWQQKYRRIADGDAPVSFSVDALLTEHAALFSGEGSALDVACGLSGNALWLAQSGYNTTAVDGSKIALDALDNEARRRGLSVTTVAADLERWAWPHDAFDVVTVFRYLDRNIFAGIAQALKPGGLLIYQTFNENHLQQRPDFNPDYVLQMNELNESFNQFEVIINDQTGSATRYISRAGPPTVDVGVSD